MQFVPNGGGPTKMKKIEVQLNSEKEVRGMSMYLPKLCRETPQRQRLETLTSLSSKSPTRFLSDPDSISVGSGSESFSLNLMAAWLRNGFAISVQNGAMRYSSAEPKVGKMKIACIVNGKEKW